MLFGKHRFLIPCFKRVESPYFVFDLFRFLLQERCGSLLLESLFLFLVAKLGINQRLPELYLIIVEVLEVGCRVGGL